MSLRRKVLAVTLVLFVSLAGSISAAQASGLSFQINKTSLAGAALFYHVVFGNGRFVAVGTSGTAMVSTDGTNWLEAVSGVSDDLMGLVYDNAKFVAVGSQGNVISSVDGMKWVKESQVAGRLHWLCYGNGTYMTGKDHTGEILTSSDLKTWTEQKPGTPGVLIEGVAWGQDRFVGFSEFGKVMATQDGKNWSEVQNDLMANYFAIGYQGGKFILLGKHKTGTAGRLLTSTDGLTWSEKAVSGNGFVAMAYGLGTHVVVGLLGSQLTSGDGENWVAENKAESAGALAFGKDIFVMASLADGSIWSSTTGRLWSQKYAGGAMVQVSSMTFANGKFVASAMDMPKKAVYTMVSADGAMWTVTEQRAPLQCIIPLKTQFMAYAREHGLVYTSQDGVTWTPASQPVLPGALVNIIPGPNQSLAIGLGGSIATSSDAATWTTRSSPIKANLYGGVYGQEMYVVVGANGAILTSADGSGWADRSQSPGPDLVGAAYGAGTYVVTGDNGAVYTSPNGIAWTKRNSGVGVVLWDVKYTGSEFVAVGNMGTVITSPDGITWTTLEVPTKAGLRTVAVGNDRVVLSGVGGSILAASNKNDAIQIVLRIGHDKMTVKGKQTKHITLDAKPVLMGGRTLLPIRPVVEAIGGTISYDATEQRVDIARGDRKISLWIGKNTALVNGANTQIDVANAEVKPVVVPPGRTLLPLRFVAENLGATLHWAPETQTITITFE